LKIKILGTCAAEGWPALFCNCTACRKAGQLGGKNLRTRSSIQVDDLLKVDLPPDSLIHTHKYNLKLHELKYLLITHSHADHLCAGEIEYIFHPYAVPAMTDNLKIVANSECIDIMKKAMESPLSEIKGLLNEVRPFETLSLPPYSVTTLKAKHKPDLHPLNYIIEKDDKSLLYACDTGFYEEETWEFLKDRRVDMVISECTEGPNRSNYKYHMGFPDVLDFREKADKISLSDSDTQWILTHFSHGGGLVHDELVSLMEPEGFKVAWDGLEIEI
jgi:phosphoribosyl 1,2-cyclic phosphate phosphodiesterase